MFSELDIKNFVISVSNTDEGMDFIYFLLDSFNTFSFKVNLNNSEIHNIAGAIKREQGEFILDLLREYNFDKYVEIERRRKEETRCLKQMN